MFIYRLLTIILSPVIFGHILWTAIRNKQSRYFWQRLGFNYSKLPANSIWFHCASVGEVSTLLPLIKNIHREKSKLNIIITTNTVTGAKIVDQQNLNYLFHSYLPFDWLYSINRFLSSTKPVSIYIMETEIWPNLFTTCYKNNTAVTLINARLTSKTTSTNAWVKALLKSSLAKVKAIYARTEKDAQAYKVLSENNKIITIAGNLKLTTVLNNHKLTEKNHFSINREYVLVASTHDDEEVQIYSIWKKHKRKELLIIAPRHPERAISIIKKLSCNGLSTSRLSQRSKNMGSIKQPITDKTTVFLLDTVGELTSYFKNAKLVIMGGSFTPTGGHNILEPASYNNAIITGPYMENFKDELELMINKKAIIQVESYETLDKTLTTLLDDKDHRTSLQNNTKKLAHNTEVILDSYTSLILNQQDHKNI